MRSHAAPVAVVLALLLVTPAATTALQDAPAPNEPQVTIDVRVEADGDARWSISTRFALNSSNETRAFQRLAEEYETGRTDVGFSASRFREIAGRIADRTDRDMAITGVNRSGYVVNRSGYVGGDGGNKTGVIALTFTWTEFGQVQGDRVVVDDVFAGDWFDGLSENQVLRLHSPEEYGVETANPPALLENATATWTGPQAFDSNQPKVVFLEGAGPTTTPDPPGPTEGVQMVFAVLAALLVGGLVAYAWTRRSGESGPSEPDSGDGPDDGTPPEPDPGEPSAGDQPVDGGAAGGDGSAAGDAAGGAAGDAAGDAGGGTVDPELLSDEERVEQLLRRNGGRMKQGDIVSETGWSNAKVSQLLSSMADEERVEKLRIGRENLITLADEDVDDPV